LRRRFQIHVIDAGGGDADQPQSRRLLNDRRIQRDFVADGHLGIRDARGDLTGRRGRIVV